MDQRYRERGLRHLVKAFGWSMAGLDAAFRYQAAFRQELAASVILVPLAFYLGQSGLERAFLVASLLIVLVTELINSAVETAIDRVGIDHHPLSKQAKDLGSAAVFVAMVNVAAVWLLVLTS